MTIIGLIGPKAAGKDTVATYIKEKKGNAVAYRFAGILDDILNILFLPITRENEIRLVALRDVFGGNVLVHAMERKIKGSAADIVIVMGIRFQNELDLVRKFPSNKLIFVDSNLQTRYNRQVRRFQKADDDISFEKFLEVEQARTEVDIQKLGEQADFKIANNGSEEELYAQIDSILQGLI